MRRLLGVGGTDDSVRALERALGRLSDTDDELTVAVLENPESAPDPDEVEERVRGLIEESDVSEDDVDVVRLSGHPGSALVEHAEDGGYDEIALGGGERSPMGKINLGGVAEFVLLNSRVSVRLIR